MILIAAEDNKHGIGKNGVLPWRLKGDMAFFKEVTSSPNITDVLRKHGLHKCDNIGFKSGLHSVVMGRKTWDSIPAKWRPLDNRTNVVVTRNHDLELPEHVIKASSLQDIPESIGETFIAGGSQIYREALDMNMCSYMFLTLLEHDFECDTYLPANPQGFECIDDSGWKVEGNIRYLFMIVKNMRFGGGQ